MEAAEKKYMHDLAKLEDLFIKADIPPSCKAHEKNERKEKSPRAVRLRRMSRDELLLAAIYGETLPDKRMTRAEIETAMFQIEHSIVEMDIEAVLLGEVRPKLFDRQSSAPLAFRSMLDFHASIVFHSEAHYQAENTLFMLAQLARKIGSCALDDILRLRVECSMAWTFTAAKANRLAARFAECWNLVMAEYELLDDAERERILVRPLEKSTDSFEDTNPYIKPGMTDEEHTASERKFALEQLHRRIPHYIESVAKLRGIVSHAADQLAAGRPLECTMDKPFLNLSDLRDALAAETDIYYIVYDDPKHPDHDILDVKHEKTDETAARESLVAELDRLLDVATAAAQRIESQTAYTFAAVKEILDSRNGDFSAPETNYDCGYSRHLTERQRQRNRIDLRSFLLKFHQAFCTFFRHSAIEKLGDRPPVKVEMTNKSVEVIAKAIKPGKGGARRRFDVAVQEQCWHYWKTGQRNSAVVESMRESGRKVAYGDVFAYYKKELGALNPPIDSLEVFVSALRARTNRISRQTSH